MFVFMGIEELLKTNHDAKIRGKAKSQLYMLRKAAEIELLRAPDGSILYHKK